MFASIFFFLISLLRALNESLDLGDGSLVLGTEYWGGTD